MLRRTQINFQRSNAVVVTLLSSSPALSRRAQAALQSVLGIEPVAGNSKNNNDDDKLNALFQTPLFRNTQWDSVASKDPSGTILHFLSVAGSDENRENEQLSVLSLVEQHQHDDSTTIQASRNLLAEKMKESGSSFAPSSMMKITMKRSLGKPLNSCDVLGYGGGLPLLKTSSPQKEAATTTTLESAPSKEDGIPRFKEICLPYFDDASYPDGRTLLSTLSESLHRPAVGLYQFRDTLAVRPLPSAKEDRVLPQPSFVFYKSDIAHDALTFTGKGKEDTTGMVSYVKNNSNIDNGVRTAKIGFSSSFRGQYMVSHPDLPGLDIRLTDTDTFSSHFPEAQQALLAGSLAELQSNNVLSDGVDGKANRSDAMNGLGDCWVEFRANMKQPSGFIKHRRTDAAKPPRVAKIPDLPYE